ncbi:hypothetical protein [Absidia glauca]|uniref:Uncharacterized protein n=1 Tax=Absidia glauca TaxID=4829 RepID=A0A163MVU7_ABSGL|nr:hypothetical protein [Absidia glauca]
MAGFEQSKSLTSEELLISQNRDRQPAFKFHIQHNEMYIYRLIPRIMHVYVVCDRKRSEKPPKCDQLEWCQKWEVVQGNQVL